MGEGSAVNARVVSDCFTTHSQQFYEVQVTDVDINLKSKQINKTKKKNIYIYNFTTYFDNCLIVK